jgi:hypothetical protein
MFGVYSAYTDDEPDEVIVEELIDWVTRRMPRRSAEAFKARIVHEPGFWAGVILLMRGKAALIYSRSGTDRPIASNGPKSQD